MTYVQILVIENDKSVTVSFVFGYIREPQLCHSSLIYSVDKSIYGVHGLHCRGLGGEASL